MADTITTEHAVTTRQDGSGRYDRTCICGWAGAIWMSRKPADIRCPREVPNGG